MRSSKALLVFSAIFLVWFALTGTFFCIAHPLSWKPFQDAWNSFTDNSFSIDIFIDTWLSHILSLLLTAGFFFLSLFLGRTILEFIHPVLAGSHRLFSLSVGFLGLTWMILGCGLLGLLYAPFIYFIGSALGTAGLVLWLWHRKKDSPVESPRTRDSKPAAAGPAPAMDWFAKGILAIVCCMLVFILIAALAPELGWDPLVYHLRASSHFAGAHRIIPLPQIVHSYFPFTMEMLYTLGFVIKDESLAKLFNTLFALMLAWGFFAFIKEDFPPGSPPKGRTGWLAIALFCAAPAVAILSVQAYNDIAMCLFAFMALWAMSRALTATEEKHYWPWLALSGIFAGVMIGLKYSGLLYVAVLGVLLAWKLFRAKQKQTILSSLLLFWALSFALALPWFIKNFIWTGNPLYPFFATAPVFRETGFNPYFTLPFAEKVIPYSPSMGLWGRLWHIFQFPWEVGVTCTEVGAAISVLFLALIPLVLFYRRKLPSALSPFLLFTLLGFIASGMTAQGYRYLLPCLAAMTPALAAGVFLLFEEAKKPVVLAVKELLLFFLALNALQFVQVNSANYNNWAVSMGFQSRDMYLEFKTIPTFYYYRMARSVNQSLPPRSKLFIVGDIMSYFYDREAVFDYQYISPSVLIRVLSGSGTADEMYRRLHRLGITHVVYNQPKAYTMEKSGRPWAWDEKDLPAYRDLWLRHFKPLGSQGPIYLFELNQPGEITPPKTLWPVLPALEEKWLVRGDMMLGQGQDLAGAMAAYKEALHLVPGLGSVNARIGYVLLKMQKPREAKVYLESALQSGLQDVNMYIGLAYIASDIFKENEKAMEYSARALALDPFNTMIRRNLAVLDYKMGRIDLALTEIQRAIRIDPNDKSLREMGEQLAREAERNQSQQNRPLF